MSKQTKESKLTLNVKVLNDDATLPTQAHDTDAGIDLYSSKKEVIVGGSVKRIETGIALGIPKGYFAKVFDRSGYGLKSTISFKAGVIDEGYTGEVGLIASNTGPYPVTIPKGSKIAQIVLLPYPKVQIKQVKTLGKTQRGEKGFGSTDKIEVFKEKVSAKK